MLVLFFILCGGFAFCDVFVRVNISLFLCQHQNKNLFDLTCSQHSASAGWDRASIHMVVVDSLASMTNTLWRNEQLRANKNLKHIFQCTPKQEVPSKPKDFKVWFF